MRISAPLWYSVCQILEREESVMLSPCSATAWVNTARLCLLVVCHGLRCLFEQPSNNLRSRPSLSRQRGGPPVSTAGRCPSSTRPGASGLYRRLKASMGLVGDAFLPLYSSKQTTMVPNILWTFSVSLCGLNRVLGSYTKIL